MKYQPPFDPGLIEPVNGIHNADADAAYVNGNPATGQAGSIVPAEALEHVMREIVEVISWSGQTPSHLDLTQLRKALKAYVEAAVASNAGGIPIYEGLSADEKPKHKIRPLIPGTNITIDLVEDPPDSGRYGLRINAAGGGGGGGGDLGLANDGDGVQVFKGIADDVAHLRTFYGVNGIAVTQETDKVKIDGAGISPSSLATLAPMMIVQQIRAGNAAPQALPNKTWTRRALTTELINQIPDASFSSGTQQITLPAGTYRVEFAAAAWSVGNHKARVQDVTHGVTLSHGITCDSYVVDTGILQDTCNASTGVGRFTLSETSVIELQHWGAISAARTGKLGDTTNIAPETHLDSWISLTREAAG